MSGNSHLLNIYTCHPENRVNRLIWPGPAQGSAQSRSSGTVGCNGFKELVTLDFNSGLSLKKHLHRPELCAACPESRNRLKSLVHLGKEEEVSQISTDKSEILIHLNESS